MKPFSHRKTFFLLITPVILAGISVACALPAQLSTLAGPSATPSLTATATVTPTPTATPTPQPDVYLDGADLALRNGDWDNAAAQYGLVLGQSASQDLKADAQLGLGTTQLRAKNYDEAVLSLTTFLQVYPDHSRTAEAYYLRAQAYQHSGKIAEAVADYDSYLNLHPGILDGDVLELIGDLLWGLDLPLEAVDRYRSAAAYTPAGETLNLQVKIGQALQDAGDLQAALAQFQQVKEQTTSGSTVAAMNLLMGKILEETSDIEGAHALFLESVENYPEAYDTYLGLISLVEAGVEVDEYTRGIIDYYAGAYEPALAAFDRALAAAPDGTTLYYRGLTALELGDPVSARQNLDTLIQQYPENPHWVDAYAQKAVVEWAYLDLYEDAVQTYLNFAAAVPEHGFCGDMLFAAGRTAERAGMLEQAAQIWLRIPVEYPLSPLAFQGAFESGIVRYRLGQTAAAHEAFQIAREKSAGPGDISKALLWIGKTYQSEGNEELSRTAWEECARTDPTGYYSERSRDLLEGREPFQSEVLYDFSTDTETDRLEAEAWLRTAFSITTPDPLDQLDASMEADIRIVRAREYWSLGMFEEAREYYDVVREEVEGDAEKTYRLMHELLDQGVYRSAILASRQILELAGMDDTATMNAPVYFNHIRFGSYYGEVLLPEAAAFGLDGLYLMSVARQETLFEPFVTSYAAARGLMQVIPSTGAEIASQLNWPEGYDEDDLYRPVISARFGAYYLSRQRDTFDGDLFAALAAYNAGAGNASAWKELAPNDPDLFLEVIRIDQPHHYIRAIYEVYTIYRSLYASQVGE
ncbi:MAG: tetratricopeptide repeat protein [Anaerolineales bacterium]|nr:tetratricopeptide repeat protein [Anaerolineales bacterium]